jgi:hypothetical protein
MRTKRLILILIFGSIPAAFLSGVIMASAAAAASTVVDALERQMTLPYPSSRSTSDEDFEMSDCGGVSGELAPALGLLGFWPMLVTLMIAGSDRYLEYWSEGEALRALRAHEPALADLDDLKYANARCGLASDTALSRLITSVICGLYPFDIKRAVGLNRANLMRKRAVYIWSAALDRPNRLLFLIAVAAPLTGVTIALSGAFDVITAPGGLQRMSLHMVALDAGQSIVFMMLGFGIGLAAYCVYRSVREKHNRLRDAAEWFSFDVLMASRRAVVGGKWPGGCSNLFSGREPQKPRTKVKPFRSECH